MLNSNEIKNVKFSKQVGGYKQEDVDLLLKKICEDYDEYESRQKKFQSKVEELKKELGELRKEKESINNVLVSAQKLADKTVEEAKERAEQIVAEATQKAEKIQSDADKLYEELHAKNEAERTRLTEEMACFEQEQEVRKEAMLAAAREAVDRQQALFDSLCVQVAEFKAKVLPLYEDSLSVIKALPDRMPQDAEQIARAAALKVDELIDAGQLAAKATGISKAVEEKEAKEEPAESVKEEPDGEAVSEKNEEQPKGQAEKPENEPTPKIQRKSFFGKKDK